ncbi:MAG: DUF4838 domain-containing protein [Planctomycetota bacterium]|nr:MAG: DUF4838 domain-containing protein [Planctomycetota bacterium]
MRNCSVVLRGILWAIFGVGYLTIINVCPQAHGQSASVISVPEQADVTLNFAAAELSKYFKCITGRDYLIETQPGNSPLVRLKVDTGLKHDGYRIYRDGDSICISGGSSRGCLYGVYTLLVELGCKFPIPGKEYEIIPRLEKISWSGPTIQSEPAVAGRGILIYPLNDAVSNRTREIARIAGQSELFYFHPFNVLDEILELIDWMAKNRFNFLSLLAGKIPPEVLPKLKEAFVARDMGMEWGMHWLPKYLPRSLFEEHPEYFRMENGKRTPKLNMCPSSSEAADIIAKNSLDDWDQLRDFPRFETLHLWPDDLNPKVHRTSGWCYCEKCKGYQFGPGFENHQ